MAIPEYLPLGRLLFLAVVSIFWGLVMEVQALWTILRLGPTKYFYSKRRPVRPEVLDNPELGTHHYARMKNIRLHYVSKGPDKAPLVLFLHGFPELWYSWRYQLKEFGQDYRAVAVDMRGYGESERPQGIAEYRMEKLTDDIKEFIEYLGYKSCYLVSHDWGGAVAWGFTAKYPDMVDKLIVCNCAHGVAFRNHLQTHRSQLLKSWYMFFFQIPCLPEIFLGSQDGLFLKDALASKKNGIKPKNLTEDDLEAFMYTFKDYVDRTGPVNYYRAALRYKPEPLVPYKIKVPTLIIWGTGDAFLEKAMAESSKKFVENDCTVKYVEGATHWVQQDEPEVVNNHIRQFLSS